MKKKTNSNRDRETFLHNGEAANGLETEPNQPKSKRKRSERTPKATEVSLSATCSRFLLSRAQIFAISAAEEWCLYSSLSKKRLGRLATSLEGAMSSLLFPRTDRFKLKLGQTRDGRQKHLFCTKRSKVQMQKSLAAVEVFCFCARGKRTVGGWSSGRHRCHPSANPRQSGCPPLSAGTQALTAPAPTGPSPENQHTQTDCSWIK